MSLTPEQMVIFKAALLAELDPELVIYRKNGQTGLISDWYNRDNTEGYIIWKYAVTQDEIMQNGMDWTRVDNLSIGKARIWEWMFSSQLKSINPSKANVRAGINAVWVGTAADLAVRAAVYVHCKKAASRIDKLFATGAGTDISPSLGLNIVLTEQDVDIAIKA